MASRTVRNLPWLSASWVLAYLSCSADPMQIQAAIATKVRPNHWECSIPIGAHLCRIREKFTIKAYSASCLNHVLTYRAEHVGGCE